MMKIIILTAATITLVSGAWATDQPGRTTDRVVICIKPYNDFGTLYAATRIAGGIFGRAGVKLEWHEDRRFCQTLNSQIIINLSNQEPPDIMHGALAYALPYEGVHIEVFYDRIAKESDPAMRSALLAHVLAHEIAHLLEGTDHHSDRGIMKARWDSHDRLRMLIMPFAFEPRDVEMIHAGLNAREVRQARGPLLVRLSPDSVQRNTWAASNSNPLAAAVQ
jgi:hypothetical protein